MERSLAHIEKIAWIRPIDGADNIERIGVLGWVLIARKGEFKEGDLCVFFEIDSKLPEKEWSKFLEAKHYKVKTMKLSKFGVISQGLALPIDAIQDLNGKQLMIGDDVTEILGVKYSVEEDNIRKAKANPNAKYNAMAARHSKLAKQKWFRWLMKRTWGKKLLFFFFGKKRDTPLGFPKNFEFIHKTDETRCENLDQEWLFSYKKPLVKTTKCDGTSGTFILERKKHGKYEYYVCSRNVRQLTPDQATYHKDNVYWNAEFKYNIKDFLQKQLEKDPSLSYVCVQGEICGPNIQGNPHKLPELRFLAFNYIDSNVGRWGSVEGKSLCNEYGIEWVPIVDTEYILPDDMETLKLEADGGCEIPGASGLREGYVYRSLDGKFSFKNVSRKYLLKHDQ